MGGGVWVQLLGVGGPALVLFLFYANVSGMYPQSRLSSYSLRYWLPGLSSTLVKVKPTSFSLHIYYSSPPFCSDKYTF